jgi:hypothetical protein
MLAAACLFASLASAAHCIPARWPSGRPKSLELLEGSPINAVLLEPAHWNRSFVEAARRRHVAVLGVIHPGGSVPALARRAAQFGMAAVVLDGDFSRAGAAAAKAGLPVIELPARQKILSAGDAMVTGTAQALWPGIQIEHGGKVSTGPSSAPWIDTNTGFLRFLSAATPSVIWLGERPPPGNVIPVRRYLLAIADAAIVNARWIVSLDRDFERRLLRRESTALQDWNQINGYLRYFESHSEWRDTKQFGTFAVLEDAAGGGLLSAGLLDMLSVLHKTARPIAARRLDAGELENAQIVLNAASSLDGRERSLLEEYGRSRGKLLEPPPGWYFPPVATEQIRPTPQQADAIQPLWESTYDATLRGNFGARTFNTSTIIFTIRASGDSKKLIVHLLNYADYISEDIAVQVTGLWRTARLYAPGEPAHDLPVYPVRDGTGVDISKIDLLGSLVFE